MCLCECVCVCVCTAVIVSDCIYPNNQRTTGTQEGVGSLRVHRHPGGLAYIIALALSAKTGSHCVCTPKRMTIIHTINIEQHEGREQVHHQHNSLVHRNTTTTLPGPPQHYDRTTRDSTRTYQSAIHQSKSKHINHHLEKDRTGQDSGRAAYTRVVLRV